MNALRLGLLLAVAAVVCGPGQAAARTSRGPRAGLVVLAGSRVNLRQGEVIGRPAVGTRLTVDLALRIRDRAGLNALVRAEYTPGSGTYHRFLRPAQFAARFAPRPAQRRRIERWLRGQGLSATASRNGLQIAASGTVGRVEAAFQTPLVTYRWGARTFYANSGVVRLPASFAASVLAVSGLDSAPEARPLDLAVAPRTPAVPEDSPPGLTPAAVSNLYDFQSIYGAGIEGQGQTIGIFQLSDYLDQNIATYDSQFNLPAGDIERVAVRAGTQSGAKLNEDENECELDIEVAHTTAPAAKILVYEGSSLLPVYNQMVSDDRAQVISTSYGATEAHQLLNGPDSESLLTGQDQLFEEAAAQGQGVFGPAGDNGAYDAAEQPNDPSARRPQVDFPASDPWVTAVGATMLQPDGVTEEPWAEPQASNPTGTGGGLSTMFSRPWYQVGPGVLNSYSNGMRQVPDVSAFAGNATQGRALYVASDGPASWQQIHGTSVSTPFVAGYAALANQYLGQQMGFLNPSLYALGQHTFGNPPYYDVTSGNNLLYPATPGWDFASGWGTIDGAAFLNDLQSLGPVTVRPIDLHPTVAVTGVNHHPIEKAQRGWKVTLYGILTVWAIPATATVSYHLTLTGPTTLRWSNGKITLRRAEWGQNEEVSAPTSIPRGAPRGTYVATFRFKTASGSQQVTRTLIVS